MWYISIITPPSLKLSPHSPKIDITAQVPWGTIAMDKRFFVHLPMHSPRQHKLNFAPLPMALSESLLTNTNWTLHPHPHTHFPSANLISMVRKSIGFLMTLWYSGKSFFPTGSRNGHASSCSLSSFSKCRQMPSSSLGSRLRPPWWVELALEAFDLGMFCLRERGGV